MLRSLYAALMLAVFAINLPVSAQLKYEKPSDIPVEAFAALPTFSRARLSPSGTKVAYFISYEGRRHLVVQNLDGSQQRIIPPWEETLELQGFFWKTDDMIVFDISMTRRRIEFTTKLTESRSISYNLKNPEFTWLGKPNTRRHEVASQIERVVDYLVDDPDHILLELDMKLDGSPEVYRVNLKNGRRKKVRSGRKGINYWFADHTSEIRLGSGYKNGSDKRNVIFKNTDGKWIDLKKIDWFDKYTIEGFGLDASTLYVSGLNKHRKKGLYSLKVESGEITKHLFSHQEVDIDGAYQHSATGKLVGVSYIDDFHRIKYFDKSLDKLQQGLAKALPDYVTSIVSKARDKELYLIYAENDTNPGDYYFYDRAAKKLSWITTTRSEIEPKLMAAVKKVEITTRDNNSIPGYLTIPKGFETKNLPTIILPHGGPEARDTAEWDWWAQFYASRGYLVLKPNFRGSTGYGPEFQKAGEQQWGGLMQDDVTDATKWLIETGQADPNRICIVGASYGGYAALMGVIKEPSLYKCAISVNGVTSISQIKGHDRRLIGGKDWIKDMGLKGVDDDDISPHDRVSDVNTPVLLMSSVDDTRIPYKHSEDMHKKLKRHKKNSQYVKIPNGTHHMLTAESRLITLRETEKFLAKHIGK